MRQTFLLVFLKTLPSVSDLPQMNPEPNAQPDDAGVEENAPLDARAKMREKRRIQQDIRAGRVSAYAVQQAERTAAQASKHMTPERSKAFHDAAMDKAMNTGGARRKGAGSAARSARKSAADDVDEKLDQVWASLNLKLDAYPRDRINIRSAMLRADPEGVVFSQKLLNNFLVKIGRGDEVVKK